MDNIKRHQKDRRLTEIDRKIGIVILPCKNCNMEFHTLYRDDLYCAFCQLYEKCKNPREFKMEEKARKHKRRKR